LPFYVVGAWGAPDCRSVATVTPKFRIFEERENTMNSIEYSKMAQMERKVYVSTFCAMRGYTIDTLPDADLSELMGNVCYVWGWVRNTLGLDVSDFDNLRKGLAEGGNPDFRMNKESNKKGDYHFVFMP
jgi:hypothetical protein